MSKYGHIPYSDFEAFLNKIGGEDVMRGFLRGEFELTSVAKATEKSLESLGTITIDIDQSLTKEQVDEFLKTRDGLYVEEQFNTLFGDANVVAVPNTMELLKFRLTKDMKDLAIRKELPAKHEFGAFEFRLMLAFQLKRQWNGEAGIFRTDGWAEIFYVTAKNGKVFAVRVYRYSGRWLVNVWELGVCERDAGRSVYSRN